MILTDIIQNNKNICEKCRGRNLLIQCACGCGEILFHKSNQYKIRRFIKGHEHRGRFGNKANNWRGGIHTDTFGYIMIYKPEHPNHDIHRCVREHRLIMENYLGRYLTKQEEIHHINGIKTDNRIENLLLTDRKNHMSIHSTGNKYGLIIGRDERTCYFNKNHKTYVRIGGFKDWYKYGNGHFICSSCYHRERKRDVFGKMPTKAL